jgi:2-oxoglutarate ferredoxin oxidoreductase subunit alpha
MAFKEFDYSILIGGEAGQGIQTIGYLLAKVFLKFGYSISTYQSYQSRIRGGHNYMQIRVASRPVHSVNTQIDILIALDANSVTEHCGQMPADGLIIYDAEKVKPASLCARSLGLEISKISSEAAALDVLVNTLFLGILMGLMNCPAEPVKEMLRRYFHGKSDAIIQKNLQVFDEGLAYIQKDKEWAGKFGAPLPEKPGVSMAILGNQAIALGAVAANCKFFTAYPMTPSSTILDTMAEMMQTADLVVEQAEDEIAALNMVLGASYAGVRAMTGSSGGGFSLMVEALSLAGIIECPAVIAVAQRPGPATGLPTRTQQGELEFLIYAGHGEFPRVVLAPGNISECFYFTSLAFNLADRYQIPVLIMTDQYLADLFENTIPFDPAKIAIDRGKIVKAEGNYLRYQITPDGVSPRAFPGTGPGLVVVDSDEHTEDGHLTEDLKVRVQMVEKRMAKNKGLIAEMLMPEIVGTDKENALLCWGSNVGVGRDAVELLNSQGKKISLIHFKQLWPLDEKRITDLLGQYNNLIVFENNATGQLAHLLRAETSIHIQNRILKYDGQPFFLNELVLEVRKLMKT